MVDGALDFLDVPLLQTEKRFSIRFAIRLHFNTKFSSFDAIFGRFFLVRKLGEALSGQSSVESLNYNIVSISRKIFEKSLHVMHENIKKQK